MSESQGLHASPSEWPRALFYVALLFSIYQIVTAAFHPVSSQVLRAGHVGFLFDSNCQNRFVNFFEQKMRRGIIGIENGKSGII